MGIFVRHPRMRWAVPLAAAVVLVSGSATIGVVQAATRDSLAPRTAGQLVTDVQKANLEGFSGTVSESTDLGLPAVPGVGDSNSSQLSSMISGTHTLRLWYAGPQHVRASLMGTLGESDVIRNGTNLWIWSSHDKTVSHRTLPASSGPSKGLQPTMSPPALAHKALSMIRPTTKVTPGGTVMVAGRSAYDLVLRPRDSGTLVRSIHIAIDSAAHVPTQVQVFARGMSKPAISVGFTSFDPTTPSSSVFAFTPPPGAKVTQSQDLPSLHQNMKGRSSSSHQAAQQVKPRVVGSGWSSVAVLTIPHPSGTSGPSGSRSWRTPSLAGPMGSMLDRLPHVSGSWGSGRLLQGTLFSALLTDDGHLVVGAVPPSGLYRALDQATHP